MRKIISSCDICGKEIEELHELQIAINGAYQLRLDFCDIDFDKVKEIVDKCISELQKVKK